MKKNLIIFVLMSIFITPVMADKPEWAGKGKPTAEQKEAHKTAMEAKEKFDEDDNPLKDKKDKKDKKYKKSKKSNKDEKSKKRNKDQKAESEKSKGLDEQRLKKTGQIRKELDKGSEKGKELRGENSKKWWKFWDE